jgi:hypothetical protein
MKKTININKELHDRFKKYCVDKGVSITNLIEFLIEEEISGFNHQTTPPVKDNIKVDVDVLKMSDDEIERIYQKNRVDIHYIMDLHNCDKEQAVKVFKEQEHFLSNF